MDPDEFQRILAEAKEAGERRALEEHEPEANDAFEIARALLQVLGRRFGAAFVAEVQREVFRRADDVEGQEEPWCRDAEEIRKVANAGYFTDLIDELASDGPSGRA
jgi:DNA integrity scanning protein DisA with diadenylate cyclase activity